MVEVVFSTSACGSLKVAQHYGEGRYHGGAVGVIFDGNPTAKERAAAQRKAEEYERRRWETAVPLGGSPRDVYCLDFALSVGHIAADDFIAARQRVFEVAFSIFPDKDAAAKSEKHLAESSAALAEVLRRAESGETLRIWYSDQPDELCGMYHLCAALRRQKYGDIHLIKLPVWSDRGDELMQHQGWGGISPGEWGQFLSLAQAASPALLAHCSAHWTQLQEENAPLRAVVNGRLVGVGEDFYDRFLLREIAAQEEEFMEARLIAAVLGRYDLGIGDVLLHERMEAFLRGGLFTVTRTAEDGYPVYRRTLKKTELWYKRFGEMQEDREGER